MPSLSAYDNGKLASHGRFFEDDISAGNDARKLFFESLSKHSPRSYRPLVDITLGNHENRIERAANDEPRAGKTYSLDRLDWRRYGVTVHPFLRPAVICGVMFVHYCPLNANGQVSNGKNGCDAKAQGRRLMRSCATGHRQGIDIAYCYSPGRTVVSLVAGSFYQHQEKYLTGMGETYWRGVVMLNDINRDGSFDPCPVSLSYLRRKYG